jgi:hypothetical protein
LTNPPIFLQTLILKGLVFLEVLWNQRLGTFLQVLILNGLTATGLSIVGEFSRTLHPDDAAIKAARKNGNVRVGELVRDPMSPAGHFNAREKCESSKMRMGQVR